MEKNKEDFNYYTYKVGIYYPSDWLSEEEKKNFKPYVPVIKARNFLPKKAIYFLPLLRPIFR